ncbi:MAG: formaldehyde-activating enzyme [Pirellulaceae bacterium]
MAKKKPSKPAKSTKPAKPSAKVAKAAKTAKSTKRVQGKSSQGGGKKIRATRKELQPIILKSGEALVEADAAWSAAEPEVVIGQLNGPVGYAIAQMIGNQSKGHSKVFAILNCDVQVRPLTVMVSKVTVNNEKYTNILMGTVQAAIAHGVLDAVREGHIAKEQANELGIICSVWLDPSIVNEAYDPEVLFQTNRQATSKAIGKAMNDEPSIDWLLENQAKIPHFFHQLAVEGKL